MLENNVSISAAAERLIQLEAREKQLRAQMVSLCSQYGLLTQELFIIMEAVKLELGDLKISASAKNMNLFKGYLVDD